MCEFQKWRDNQPPLCEYTNKLCTMCVMGNAKTYKKALKKNNPELWKLFKGGVDNG